MLRNIGSNWLLVVVTAVVTYVLLPFNLHALGQERYGLWLLVTSMTGYLNLLMLGIPMASVHFMAQHAAQKNYDELNRIIGNCAALYLLMGLASLLIGGALLIAFDRIYNIPPFMRASARAAFIIVLFTIAAGFCAQLPQSILAAHHDFVVRNIVSTIALLVRLGVNFLLITLRPVLIALAAVLLASMMFEMTCMWIVIRHRYPYVEFKLSAFAWKTVRRIFSFSIFVLILGLAAQLMFQTDSLVIGRFLHFDQIPIYTVANSLTVYLMDFVIGIAAVVMPMATKLQAENNLDDLRGIFLKWSKIAFSLTLLAGLYLIVFGPRFIGLWIGASFESPSGNVFRILMLANFLFLPVRAVCVPVLAGLGKPGPPAIVFLLAGVVNLVLSLLWVKSWGLAGVAWGTAIPNILFAGTILVLTCRELGIAVSEYGSYVLGRAALGGIPVLLLLFGCHRVLSVTGYIGLGAAGGIMVFIFSLVWIFFVYRNDRYTDLQAKLFKFAQRQCV